MPCIPLQSEDGTISGVICIRGRKPRPRCACGKVAPYLCDGAIDGGTCDTPLCGGCAEKVGRDRHHCPDCAQPSPQASLSFLQLVPPAEATPSPAPPPAPASEPPVFVAVPDRVLGSLDPARRDLPTDLEAIAYAEAQVEATGQTWRVYRVSRPPGSWTPMGPPIEPRRTD